MVKRISTCRSTTLAGYLLPVFIWDIKPLAKDRKHYSIVGKGIHSANHVQKLKPRVEQVCRELGLQHVTEENAGRIYVNLTGGPAEMPPYDSHHTQPHYQQPHHGGQQQQEQPSQVEQVVEKILPAILRKLEKACCIVM